MIDNLTKFDIYLCHDACSCKITLSSIPRDHDVTICFRESSWYNKDENIPST